MPDAEARFRQPNVAHTRAREQMFDVGEQTGWAFRFMPPTHRLLDRGDVGLIWSAGRRYATVVEHCRSGAPIVPTVGFVAVLLASSI
ncbi:MAG: hypothetical protein JSR66_13120 [Proteobacteria bacterium]|nr:hypothetical protein [Pseudomonadota bacterium]